MSTCYATTAAALAAAVAPPVLTLPHAVVGAPLVLRPATAPGEPGEGGELLVPAAPGSVGRARRWATETAVALGATADEASVVELLASEVVTNAVRHGSPEGDVVVVRVLPHAEGVLVAVHDDGSGAPVVRDPAPEETGGRGMQLVDMLATTWGVQPRSDGGKCVWFVVALAAAAAAA